MATDGDASITTAVADVRRHRQGDVRMHAPWTTDGSWMQQSAVADWHSAYTPWWKQSNQEEQRYKNQWRESEWRDSEWRKPKWQEQEWPSWDAYQQVAKRCEATQWSKEEWDAWRIWKKSEYAKINREDEDVDVEENANSDDVANADVEVGAEEQPKEPEHSDGKLASEYSEFADSHETSSVDSSHPWDSLQGWTQEEQETAAQERIAATAAVAAERSIPGSHGLPWKAAPPSAPVQHANDALQPQQANRQAQALPVKMPPDGKAPPTKKVQPSVPLPAKQPPVWAPPSMGPPLPPAQTQIQQSPPLPPPDHRAPQSRSSDDRDGMHPPPPMRLPPGLSDSDWNVTLDRIKNAKAFDARFYKELFADRRAHDVFRQHNGAAKWFRECCKLVDKTLVRLDTSSAVAVKKVQHDKGMHFRFLEQEVHWIWHEMIGQLDNDSIDKVCSIPLLQCDFALRDKQKGPGGDPVWDFRVHRQDGSMMTLHPDWTRRTFTAMLFANPGEGDDKLSSYGEMRKCKEYRKSLGSEKLKFDPKKEPESRDLKHQ